MNIFELACLAAVLALGYFAARYFGGIVGVPGWVFGFLVGSGAAVAAYVGFTSWLKKRSQP